MPEVKCCQILTPSEFGLRTTPVQSSGNHQVQHEPEIAFQSNRDSFSNAPQSLDLASFHIRERRLHASQQKRTAETHSLQTLSDDAGLERGDVSRDIGQLRHIHQLACSVDTLQSTGLV